MKSPSRWILIGLLVAGAGLVWGLIPQSEEYSDWGFGDQGLVDVQCGSAFSEDVDPQFRDWEEGEQYRADRRSGYNPPIFEGQTADEVCEELINGVRVVAIGGMAGGAVLALIGIVGASNRSETADLLPVEDADSAPLPPPPDTSLSTPAPPVSTPAPPVSTPSAPPPPEPPPPDAGTLTRSPPDDPPPTAAVSPPRGPDSDPAGVSAGSPASRHPPTLVFADGQRIELAEHVVIGRDPIVPSDAPSAIVVAVVDATVSKTHVRVGRTGEDVWVEDLHSRNGVSIVASNGDTITTVPGRRTIIDAEDRVSVGDETSFTLDDSRRNVL